MLVQGQAQDCPLGDSRGADQVIQEGMWYQEMEAAPVLSSAAYPQQVS